MTTTFDAALRPDSARAELTRMLMGQVVAQALHAAAALGLADLLAGGPRPLAELAAATGCRPDALGRLLRALAGLGLVAEVEPDRFATTPLGDGLRDDRADSARPAALLYGEEYRRALDGLLWSVRTGKPAFAERYGLPFFAYLDGQPEARVRFDRNMRGRHAARDAAVAEAYDFSGIAALVDVGGGEGGLLRAILAAHPGPRGVLFDRPASIDRVRQQPIAPALAGRLGFADGDFFVDLPRADGYLLGAVLHDWDDERAGAILRSVRRAIAPGGHLLLVEEVLPPAGEASSARLLDLLMLALVGGRERTEAEFRALLSGNGFALERVIPTAVGRCLLEARPR